jgi:hypothetical protein
MAKTGKPLVFISYSHKDENWLDYVRSHLAVAVKAGAFETWDDRLMPGGVKWEKEIAAALSACRVFILLVSRHSLTSGYIDRVETQTALKRAETEGVHIYPILVSSVFVADDHWLTEFNWRPKDGKPLEKLGKAKRNEVMAAIVAEIVKVIVSPAKRGGASHAAKTDAKPKNITECRFPSRFDPGFPLRTDPG